jgi:acyl transferase domain-containing protein/NAD(P)H-dependent flavin oxidoreductase YrpB (nitropropane dioxygenase family)
MTGFVTFALAPAGYRDCAIAIAACRAGAVGIVNGELNPDRSALARELDEVSRRAKGPYGIKLDAMDAALEGALRAHAAAGLRWVVLDCALVAAVPGLVSDLRGQGVRVLGEVTTPDWPGQPLDGVLDGLWIKGNESGGFVGEEASFILIQKWLKRTHLPLYVRGGVTPHSAAACAAIGIAGGVLDSQLLLFDDLGLFETLNPLLRSLSGSETVAVGDGERGEYFRVLVRPGNPAAREFVAAGESECAEGLRPLLAGRTDWTRPTRSLLPIGQDVAFAADWRVRYGSLHALVAAIDDAVADHLRAAVACHPIRENGPLAQALGIRVPVVQGPMTRVSDTAEFALSVADGGALPMVALALMKEAALDSLLARTAELLEDRPWGIGLLGFAPQSLLDEQVAVALKYKPDYAIIAGGRPDQAVRLDQAGIPSFLHVPSARLIPMFMQEGARRFIFEGRECGGHIGPLSSFVLWSAMVDALLAELSGGKYEPSELQLLFAGGIHDAVSSALVQVLAAPLAARGVRVGILMGSAYLFTREIVENGSIVPQFQQEVLDCRKTIALESGPGHASRCAYTPFAEEYFRKRAEMRERKVPGDEARQVLDQLILGRLRIASKGRMRDGLNGDLRTLEVAQQRADGMYMLGQVATLRHARTDIRALHADVTTSAAEVLAAASVRAAEAPAAAKDGNGRAPADVAIIGMACFLPKAPSVRKYWANILDRVNAITEIPLDRWDSRLYFDADRQAKDKIYSKWGGFLDDMLFDPTRYGMPPKSVESVDPMQLMALEVAQRALTDAGYAEKPFDRERASVIVGASGGAGDVGIQYGLRSELPRFTGNLPDSVAERLPTWTEDSFAGILLNVVAGRIANRLNFGGINCIVDAACASALAAVYQGVSELTGGRSDLVLAGGVDTVQGPFGYLCFSKTQALSPRGRCATFAADGDGIVISEGIAMIVLKRLADAERDGDKIYAVIKGVGASSDGNAKGLTAPLPAGQLRAMRRAYAQAGFGPRAVGLFEAHGTGTVAGDTAELESTMQLVKADGGTRHQSVIGSVKTMIGHTKATAGVAGLIKASLALHHRVLPPQLTEALPNPVLRADDSPLYLVDEARPWLASPEAEPRRAAVSAFGFGGTDFHVVLEEYGDEYRDWLRSAPLCDWPLELLVWSAPDRAALKQKLAETRGQLAELAGVELRHLAASLARHWQPDAEVLTVAAQDIPSLAEQLDAAIDWLDGRRKALPPKVSHGTTAGERGKVALLFPGQGSQYTGMLRQAALQFPVCAESLSAADRALEPAFSTRHGEGVRLSDFIFPRGAYDDAQGESATQALTSTDIAQPALGAVEVALLRLMQGFGLAADMVAGHSYGEFVALHAAGAIDFETLLRLSARRGECIVDAVRDAGSELGTMAAVRAPREEVARVIGGIDDIVIANHNAPEQVVISGSHRGVDEGTRALTEAGIAATPLPVAAAFHSRHVRPALGAFTSAIDAMDWATPQLPVYANASGKPHGGDVAALKRAMAEHLVQPVEFVAQIEAMYADGARVFVEVGPKAVLTQLTRRILGDRPHAAIAIDRGNGLADLLAAFGQLLCAGIELDVRALFKRRECRIADPSHLASLGTAPSISRTAWLLNGSSARRASESPRQIGVTVEQTGSPVKSSTRSGPPVEPGSAGKLHAITPTQGPHPEAPTYAPDTLIAQRPAWGVHGDGTYRSDAQEFHMNEQRPSMNLDAAVMTEYFATMRQFLDTQSHVMTMVMGGSLAPRGVASTPRMIAPPMTVPRPAEAVIRPNHAASPYINGNGHAPAVASNGNGHAPAMASNGHAGGMAPNGNGHAAGMASNGNGHAPAMATHGNGHAPPVTLQATPATPATVPSKAREEVVQVAHGNGAAGSPAAAGSIVDRDKLGDILLGIVEEKTGYPRDMVGLDQNLEADLGIDSIKRVEVVGAMLQSLPATQREALTSRRSELNKQATLKGILDLLATSVDRAAAAA